MNKGVLKKKLKGRNMLYLTYALLICSAIFFLYTALNTVLKLPSIEKVPYIGRFIRAQRIANYAKKLPAGTERSRLEAIARAIKDGKKEYFYEASPQTFNMLNGR